MQAVVVYNEKAADQEKAITDEDDDFYAQFEIPDDLMWQCEFTLKNQRQLKMTKN